MYTQFDTTSIVKTVSILNLNNEIYVLFERNEILYETIRFSSRLVLIVQHTITT